MNSSHVKQDFGDYIIYVDESGDHSLTAINPSYPVFVLAFCVFEKALYTSVACPAIQHFKFRYFGHDLVILHEHEIVKRLPPFTFLFDSCQRETFMEDLTGIMTRVPFTILAVAVQKSRYRDQHQVPEHVYHLAVRHGLEQLSQWLEKHGQTGKRTHVIFESRGLTEDRELIEEFRMITQGPDQNSRMIPLDVILAPKRTNACGLQLADLVARPIGRYLLNPLQPNRAFDTLRNKLWQSEGGGSVYSGITLIP